MKLESAMDKPSPLPRLVDILEAIDVLRAEVAGLSIQDFAADKRKRWLVERGLEIISEASRHLPDSLKARYPAIPWRKIAGIGNVLRHEYEHVAADILWRVVMDELTPLELACTLEKAIIERFKSDTRKVDFPLSPSTRPAT